MVLAKHSVAALAYRCWESGLSVLPLLPSGPPLPAIGTWRHFFKCRAPRRALARFETSSWVVGIATGQVSGGLEVLEFEHDQDWHTFRERVERRQTGLLDGLPVARSPAGVTHLYYRCETPRTGLLAVQPLAAHASIPELRVYAHGDHSFVPAPDNGRGLEAWRLEHVSGSPLEAIPHIEVGEQLLFHEIAGTLDRSESLQSSPPTGEIPEVRRLAGKADLTVREDYDCRGNWGDLFHAANWQMRFCRHGGLHYWAAPNSPAGNVDVISGLQGYPQAEIFNVAIPADESPEWPWGRNDWTRFESYVALMHGGDSDLAGRSLWTRGFGSEPDASWVDGGHNQVDVPADALTRRERLGLSLGSLWRLLRGVRSHQNESNATSSGIAPAPDLAIKRRSADYENTLHLLSSREIRFSDLRSRYLVADLIVAGTVTCFGGLCHFQKHVAMADLALSAAQEFPFLGAFKIQQRPRRVLFMVDSALRAEIMDLCRRIAVSRGTDLRQVERLCWSSESIVDVLGAAEKARFVVDRMVEEQVDLLLVAQSDLANRATGGECWTELQRIAAVSGAAIVCAVPSGPPRAKVAEQQSFLPASTACIELEATSAEPHSGKQPLGLSRKSAGCPDKHWLVTLDQRSLYRSRNNLWKVRDK